MADTSQPDGNGKEPEDQQAGLREALNAALQMISLPRLYDLASAYGPSEFKSKPPNLQKFTEGSRLNERDAEILRTFLFASETGRLLLKKWKSEAKSPITDILRQFQLSTSRTTIASKFKGCFLAFHGSYYRRNHYVVRLLEFTRTADELIAVKDELDDGVSPIKSTLRATGIMTFPDGKPQILLNRHNDNASGLNLIIGDDVFVTDSTVAMIGQTYGVNRRREHFSRAILIRKQEASRETLLKMTGIKPIHAMDGATKKEFEYLQQAYPAQVFTDPTRKTSAK